MIIPKSPLVSVVVKTHNRSKFLYRALSCLVNQTYKSLEIIVLDHNSSDDTEEVVKSFGNKVKYHKHVGIYRDMYNIWHEMVHGEFISFLDDDDYIDSVCIEKLVKILMSKKDIDVVFSRYQYFRKQDNVSIFESKSPEYNNHDIKRLLLLKCVIPLNAVLIRKTCLRYISKIGPEIIGAFDWYLWIQIAIGECKFHQHDEILGFIQRSPDSVQFDVKRMLLAMIQCVKYYGRHLSLWRKLRWGYFYSIGYYLICYGIDSLERADEKNGRILLMKGILSYCLALKNRLKLIPAMLILISSCISTPRKSRIRIEKLFRNYLFRTYRQRNTGEYNKLPTSSYWVV